MWTASLRGMYRTEGVALKRKAFLDKLQTWAASASLSCLLKPTELLEIEVEKLSEAIKRAQAKGIAVKAAEARLKIAITHQKAQSLGVLHPL